MRRWGGHGDRVTETFWASNSRVLSVHQKSVLTFGGEKSPLNKTSRLLSLLFDCRVEVSFAWKQFCETLAACRRFKIPFVLPSNIYSVLLARFPSFALMWFRPFAEPRRAQSRNVMVQNQVSIISCKKVSNLFELRRQPHVGLVGLKNQLGASHPRRAKTPAPSVHSPGKLGTKAPPSRPAHLWRNPVQLGTPFGLEVRSYEAR